jgi:hypothetical protein
MTSNHGAAKHSSVALRALCGELFFIARKSFEEEEQLMAWVELHPEYMLVRRGGRLVAEQRPLRAP